jgi:GT2 family glycosyltransferase
MSEPYVISIILNTNRCEDTLDCLASLEQSTYQNHTEIVLDNASTDGSVDAIRSAFPGVQIVSLEENLGYAGNNNLGIRRALEQGADWVFVLNEDTIQASDCLSNLVEVGQSNPQIGIVGPMVYNFDEPQVIQSAGGLYDKYLSASHIAQNELDTGQFSQPHMVDWISGCAIMVKREVIQDIGKIDERFFYYVEEVEWCLRTVRAGWQIMHVPQAKLWHKGVRRDYQPTPSVTYYATRNRLLMLSKHKAPPMARIVAWQFITRTLISWSLKPKWRCMSEHRNAMWRGAMDFLRHRWGPMSS